MVHMAAWWAAPDKDEVAGPAAAPAVTAADGATASGGSSGSSGDMRRHLDDRYSLGKHERQFTMVVATTHVVCYLSPTSQSNRSADNRYSRQ
jgi:hypothetical protein